MIIIQVIEYDDCISGSQREQCQHAEAGPPAPTGPAAAEDGPVQPVHGDGAHAAHAVLHAGGPLAGLRLDLHCGDRNGPTGAAAGPLGVQRNFQGPHPFLRPQACACQ